MLITPTKENMPLQREEGSCLQCTTSAALFILGKEKKADPVKVAKETDSLNRPLESHEAVMHLLKKGLRIHSIGKGSLEEYVRRGPEYLLNWLRKEFPTDEKLKWTKNQLAAHHAQAVEFWRFVRDNPRYQESLRPATPNDFTETLDGERVIITSVHGGKSYVHSVLCYALKPVVWNPKRSIISVYFPDRKKDRLVSDYESRSYLANEWVKASRLLVVSR